MGNPYNKQALTEKDLTHGRQVTLHYPGGSVDLQIVGKPFVQRLAISNAVESARAIRVRNLTGGGREETRLLGDLGIMPYSTGKWNEGCYVSGIAQ
jgi:hypothetical protein